MDLNILDQIGLEEDDDHLRKSLTPIPDMSKKLIDNELDYDNATTEKAELISIAVPKVSGVEIVDINDSFEMAEPSNIESVPLARPIVSDIELVDDKESL